MLELLGNLLDNACKWAASQVLLSIECTAEGYAFTVEDDGPGVEAQQRAEVLNRGSRVDEQVAGHGLGLGIVRDIVDAWSGHLELRDSRLGGLCVHIQLPQPSLRKA
jgi:signal transduction histidine kinase